MKFIASCRFGVSAWSKQCCWCKCCECIHKSTLLVWSIRSPRDSWDLLICECLWFKSWCIVLLMLSVLKSLSQSLLVILVCQLLTQWNQQGRTAATASTIKLACSEKSRPFYYHSLQIPRLRQNSSIWNHSRLAPSYLPKLEVYRGVIISKGSQEIVCEVLTLWQLRCE